MRLWRRTVVPVLAALAAVLMAAAGAAGLDQMANTKVTNTDSSNVRAVVPDGPPSLRHLVIRGLAEGSLPGGFPYDELRDERDDENYQETLQVGPATPA